MGYYNYVNLFLKLFRMFENEHPEYSSKFAKEDERGFGGRITTLLSGYFEEGGNNNGTPDFLVQIKRSDIASEGITITYFVGTGLKGVDSEDLKEAVQLITGFECEALEGSRINVINKIPINYKYGASTDDDYLRDSEIVDEFVFQTMKFMYMTQVKIDEFYGDLMMTKLLFQDDVAQWCSSYDYDDEDYDDE